MLVGNDAVTVFCNRNSNYAEMCITRNVQCCYNLCQYYGVAFTEDK